MNCYTVACATIKGCNWRRGRRWKGRGVDQTEVLTKVLCNSQTHVYKLVVERMAVLKTPRVPSPTSLQAGVTRSVQ